MFVLPVKKILKTLITISISHVAFLSLTTIFFLQEKTTRDWRFGIRGAQRAESNLLVVTLDETYAHNMDYPDRVPRDYLANLVDVLTEYDARVIALNYEFRVADRMDSHYLQLKTAIKNAGNVVLPSQLNPKENYLKLLEVPPYDLQSISLNGYTDILGKRPIYMQQYRQMKDGSFAASFALAAVAGFWAPDTFFQPSAVSFSARHEDVDPVQLRRYELEQLKKVLEAYNYKAPGEAYSPIDFFGLVRTEHCTTHTSENILRSSREDSLEGAKALLTQLIKDKLVLVGSLYSQANGTDEFESPFGTMQGVEVQANIINNLLKASYPRDLPVVWQGVIIVAAFLLGFLAVRLISSLRRASIFIVVLVFAYALLCLLYFPWKNIFLPFALPVKVGLGSFLLSYLLLLIQRSRKHIRHYRDFDLLIYAHNQPNQYQLRLIDAPDQAGESKSIMTRNTSDTFEETIKRLQRNHTDRKLLKSFGTSLYRMLLSEDVGNAYQRSISQVRQEDKGLHIRLRMEDPALRMLPWEYLYDPQFKYFMAAHPEVILSRYVESNQPRRKVEVDHLRVLVVISDPDPESSRKWNLNPIDAAYEVGLIKAELEELKKGQNRFVDYDILKHAVPEEIAQQLKKGYQVVHFIGHSTFGKGEGKIILEDANHQVLLKSGQYFGDLLAGQNDLRLVVMNSCKSAVTAETPEASGIAYRIVECGVPAVVAMQYNIPDDVAIRFSREFYQSLAGGDSVALAATYARATLYREFRENRPRDFGIPVLFLRGGDTEAVYK